jgi:hypothetical protein
MSNTKYYGIKAVREALNTKEANNEMASAMNVIVDVAFGNLIGDLPKGWHLIDSSDRSLINSNELSNECMSFFDTTTVEEDNAIDNILPSARR